MLKTNILKTHTNILKNKITAKNKQNFPLNCSASVQCLRKHET